MTVYAHSKADSDRSNWQELGTHLEEVATLSATFALDEWKPLARLAGLWHDVGKYPAAFQHRISIESEASNETNPATARVLHSIVGAALAVERNPFGAVMTTGKAEAENDEAITSGKKGKGTKELWNCGQVRGPVQFGFATSVNSVTSIAHTITRVALTNPGDAGGEAGEEKAASGQMGRKHGVAYGLYRMHGFVSPFLAAQTGFTERDMGTLMGALEHLFDHDRSATRGEMEVRGLYLFEHKEKLGNAPAHKVLSSVTIPSVPLARSFAEYEAAGLAAPEDGSEPVAGVTCWRYV